MYSKTVTVRNKSGLHARPATEFVKEAGKYGSKVLIKRLDEDAQVNAKSIVFVLSLGVGAGTEVEISADGDDERSAVDALAELVESGFGE